MALNKDTLGTDLYNRVTAFNDLDIAPEDLENARKDFWKSVADEIIKHFKTYAVVSTTGTSTAQMGTIS